jgi:cyclic pyranopterin phosphate synthase
MIKDDLNRKFGSLRISLTKSCNFACIYCTDDTALSKINSKKELSIKELLKIVARLHLQLNLTTVRLTGGEPLLYQKLEMLISGLKQLGIPHLKMTSNAYLLATKAKALKEAGLQEINISLDAIDDASFFKITKRDKLHNVLAGIDEALKLGIKVKLNAVIMNGENNHQIMPLFNYAKAKNITIRFLETMAMGHLHLQQNEYLFTQAQILELISSYYPIVALARENSATANYWQTSCGYIFGIIANTSTPFCSDCNRLRLDQEGKVYGCLSNSQGFQINSNQSNLEWDNQLQNAMSQKQNINFIGSKMSMMAIGG